MQRTAFAAVIAFALLGCSGNAPAVPPQDSGNLPLDAAMDDLVAADGSTIVDFAMLAVDFAPVPDLSRADLTPPSCGYLGYECCPTQGVCLDGSTCVSSVMASGLPMCVAPCGHGGGQRCCYGRDPNGDPTMNTYFCFIVEPCNALGYCNCGDRGEVCCAGSTCLTGFSCSGGFCN
jgi:hypothetical protein